MGREGIERAVALLREIAKGVVGLDEGTVAAFTGFGE